MLPGDEAHASVKPGWELGWRASGDRGRSVADAGTRWGQRVQRGRGRDTVGQRVQRGGRRDTVGAEGAARRTQGHCRRPSIEQPHAAPCVFGEDSPWVWLAVSSAGRKERMSVQNRVGAHPERASPQTLYSVQNKDA